MCPNKRFSIKNCFNKICPVFCINLKMRCPRKCKCKCLDVTEKQRIQINHYRQLEKEIHIGYLVKTLRALKHMTKQKFSTREWRKVFEKYSNLGYPSEDEILSDDENSKTQLALI